MSLKTLFFVPCFLVGISSAVSATAGSSTTDATATATLTSVAEASSVLQSLYASKPSSISVSDLIESGLTTFGSLSEAFSVIKVPLSGPGSDNNENKANPSSPVYPKASDADAPYDLTEAELRKAIHIPSTFRCGSTGVQPIILAPGTGTTGYISYKGNFIPLLQNSSIADPVWLNIPNYLLDDAQTNAEYVAYAIAYIHGICGTKVAVAAWSQGNVDAQWAYKYWPSTRSKVTDHIGFSPDYHGTTLSSPLSPAAPAGKQQAYQSDFIQTLRSNGGDAAYVPSTLIYSGFYDEVVEPQQGSNASAYLLTSSAADASNIEVQHACPDQAAGTLYTHEGVLFNPLSFALLKDALSHDGPGQTSRLNLSAICGSYVTSSLGLEGFRLTENAILIATLNGGLYPNKTFTEPPIKPYARN